MTDIRMEGFLVCNNIVFTVLAVQKFVHRCCYM